MSNIATVNWKEFEVGELFDIETCRGFNTDKITLKEIPTDVYCYEFIGRTRKNYGLQGYVKNLGVPFNNKGTITISQVGTITAQYRKEDYYASQNMFKLTLKEDNKTSKHKLFLVSVLDKKLVKYTGYSHYPTLQSIKIEKIKLPTKNNEPDWEYMENYITEIENKYINKLEQHNNEKIEQALKVTGLSKEDLKEDLKVEPAKRYEKFRVGDLFDKKTIKGVPKSKEKLQENKTGYHVFGQNIKYQYPQKVLLEEQYLQTIQTPILAYSSSTAQIGYIKENFYRTGDNGAFQGLFPKKTNVAIHSLLYILVVLKKQFDWFGYATEMGNILNLEITLPATNENTPDFEYMEKAIYIYFRQVIQNWKLSNEKEIEELKQVINK